MKIVVTGGAGFIGSHLVEELLRKGEFKEITVLDNLFTGKLENIKPFLSKIKFIKGDIRDLNILKKNFDKADYVIHLAAIPKIQFSINYPALVAEVNINGTLNVLTAARDCRVKRVIFASSSSVYGNAKLPWKEGKENIPLSPYALTKLTGEHYCRLFYSLYGLETVSLRFFNVFGQRQDPRGEYAAAIPKFIYSIMQDKQPLIYGNGEQSRDFTYVKNVVNAMLLALKVKKEDAAGKIFNIACGKSINLLEVIKLINKKLNKNIKPVFKEARKGEIKDSLADISKAKTLLNYKPLYSFEQGLEETIKWLRK